MSLQDGLIGDNNTTSPIFCEFPYFLLGYLHHFWQQKLQWSVEPNKYPLYKWNQGLLFIFKLLGVQNFAQGVLWVCNLNLVFWTDNFRDRAEQLNIN